MYYCPDCGKETPIIINGNCPDCFSKKLYCPNNYCPYYPPICPYHSSSLYQHKCPDCQGEFNVPVEILIPGSIQTTKKCPFCGRIMEEF